MKDFVKQYDELILNVKQKYPRPAKYYKNGKGTCKELLIINEKLKNEFPNIKFNIHHIIPKCLGGTDDIENLVYVSIDEHIKAHWLLFQIHAHDPEHCVLLCNAYGLVKSMLNNLICGSSHKNCKSVVQIDPYTKKLIKVYDSLSSAVTQTKHKNISSVLSGDKQTAGGYFWMYKTIWDNEIERNKILSTYNKLPQKIAWNKLSVYLVDIKENDAIVLETFNSLNEAKKTKHIKHSGLISVCNNELKYCGRNKLIFMYKSVYDDIALRTKFIETWYSLK